MVGEDDGPATKRDLSELEERLRADMATKGDFVRLDGRLDSLDGKVDSLDGKVNSLDGKVNSLDGRVGSLEGKFDRLEQTVVGMEARLRDGIREDLARSLAIQREAFQAWARAFDDKYKDLPGRVSVLERDVADLKAGPPPARRKRSAR